MPVKYATGFSKQKKLYILFLIQFLILAAALGNYMLNRGKAFFKTYFPESFEVSAGELSENGKIVIEDRHGYTGSFLNFTEALDKGNYIVTIHYNTNSQGNTLKASASLLSDLDFRTAPITLEPSLHSASITLDLNRSTDEVVIDVSFTGEGYLEIDQISISETGNHHKQNIFHAFCLCILLALIYVFYQSDSEKRSVMFGLGAIFLLSCYPLMADYMQVGHDLPFHLLRIEGIYNGLLQGDFPVKIHPVWARDYGYAVGVFYGDAALYPAAALRLFGFSIQTAYKYFVVFMNLATVLITYFSFRKIFGSKNAGLISTALYTFSLYRLADVYTRAAVGEYTALTFLPLVLCGFYLIFTEKNQKQNWLKNAVLVAIGLTGVIQSHVLSCEIIVIFVVILCLILIKRVIRPHTFLALASGAGLTLLMNVGFLVPFLDFFDDSIYINSPDWGTNTAYSIQNMGMYPVQLLGLFHRTNGGSWSTYSGINNEAAYSLGLVLTLCVILFLYIALCCHNKKEKDPFYKPALLCCGLGILALYMCTCYFPWDALAALGSVPEMLISNLQFPWRFLSVATILLIFPSCYAILNVQKVFSATKASVILGTLATLFVVSSGWYFYEFSFSEEPYRVYDTYELNTMNMYSYEYLPAGTNPEEITAGAIYYSDGVTYTDYQKNGTTIICNVAAAEDGFIEFPLNHYKYYECRDLASGRKLSVEPGYNNMVRVNIPGNYVGQLKVSFEEPLLWRVCEAVSILTLLAVVAVPLYKRLKALIHKDSDRVEEKKLSA